MKAVEKNLTSIYTKIFWCILVVAFLVRVIGIGSLPYGVNQDEAMLAMDAWALSEYGTDRYGTFMPVHFTAWKYGQMSVLLAYLMVPFIKVLGFSAFAVRLPMAIVSTLGVALMYLISRKVFSGNGFGGNEVSGEVTAKKMALAVMALTAVNPWQIMQSRWALDCNLFPHVFLLGFYLLLLGLEKRRYLYLSMVCFGLTFYCYGIAIYTVPVFLFVYAAWCLWKKQLPFRDILISVVIFVCVALPEVITMAINMFGGSTIETPFFTMCYFPESIRSTDILFLNFSVTQLGKNIWALISKVFLQMPDHLFNALPAFGPLYHISIPFILVGIVQFTRNLFREKDVKKQTVDLALWGFLITGIWAGLITKEVNVNRINIIFYPLILLCGYGIWIVLQWFCICLEKKSAEKATGAEPAMDVEQVNVAEATKNVREKCSIAGRVIMFAYGACAVLFCATYVTSFAEQIQTYFNVDFLEITAQADALEEYDSLYITGNMHWQYNLSMSEILTQYSCKIDALYYQEKTNETGGRSLLPYSERYHFVNMEKHDFADKDGLYIVEINEVKYLPAGYEVILVNDSFVAVQL